MAKASSKSDDRIFVQNGRRHYRRSYSANEVRVGGVLLSLLAALVVWVAWQGAHPDPDLYATDLPLLQAGKQPVEFAVQSSKMDGSASRASASPASSSQRGDLPEGMAPSPWREGEVSSFDPENLYVKVNGRAGFYKSFGFVSLRFVSLVNGDDPASIVDIEMYDLGTAANALGAYAGERAENIVPEVSAEGMAHFDRNALLIVRGKLYIRAIGSDETPVIREQLEHLKSVFERELGGEALPWGYDVFVGKLGMTADQVSFMPENAFSFGFATNVYAALLEDGETELFVTLGADESEATALAQQFQDGFLGYGSAVSGEGGASWVEDRYIQTIAGARDVGVWVLGVRGAPDVATAEVGIARLEAVVATLSPPQPTHLDAESSGEESSAEPSMEESEY